jgi:hypothetical protein
VIEGAADFAPVIDAVQKMPYRIFHALLEAFLSEEAHGISGKAFGDDFYQPPFALSLSKGIFAKSMMSFKVKVLRQAQHERIEGR